MAFSSETLDFLVENKMRNDRQWFRENRARYQSLVVEPMAELVTRLGPAMLDMDDQIITEAKIDKTISRIYRDTRFSKDKSIYRSNCWLVLMRSKKLYEGLPAFYFDLSPDGFSYGMGYWQASTATMTAIRTMILAQDPAFGKALKAYQGQEVFSLEGDRYQRSRHPDAPPHLREWLDRKSISVNCHSRDFDLLFSLRLADTLLAGFQTLAPLYHFLWAAENRKNAL